MIKRILILLLVLSTTLMAQDKLVLSGFIKDVASSEDLIGANIVCEELAIGATSNPYGFYSMTLPEGNYTIRYSFIGYEDQVFQVKVDKSLRKDVLLNVFTEQLSEIILEDEALQKVRSVEMSVNRLETKAIKELPAVLGEVDIIKSIQLLPGVTSVGEGANGFNVRGGAADENLVLLDEMTLYNSSHLFGFFSVFNSDAIKDMKLYKGGIPAEYGSRVSSVLDVRQKEGNANNFAGSAGIGLISSRLLLEGPLWSDRSSFMLAGRRSYGDLFLVLSDDPAIKDNKLYFFDLNMKINTWLGDKDRLFLSSYMGRDAFKFGDRFASSWGNTTMSLRWLHLFSDRLVSNMSLNYNDYDYEISILPDGFEFDWVSHIKSNQLKYDLSYFANNQHKFKFGIAANEFHFMPGEIIPASETSAVRNFQMRDKFAYETGVYAQDEWAVSQRVLVKAGLRLSSFFRVGVDTITLYNEDPIYYDNLQNQYINGDSINTETYGSDDVISRFNNLEPRFSIKYQIDELSSIKASYQNINQYMHLITNASSPTPLDIWAPSGPYIKPLNSQQIALGYFKTSGNQQWDFSTEIYYKKLKNTLDYVDAADLEFNNNLETEILYGEGRAYGLELMIEKNVGKFTGWLAYTLSKTESLVTGYGADDPGINNGTWYPNPQDKTHDLSLVAFYKHNSKWSFSSNFVYATGIPTNYPVAKFEYEDIVVPHYNGERNQERLPSYHRIDIAATYRPLENQNREWVFSIYNVYNRKNASSVFFRESEDIEGQTEAVKLSIFPILPSVTYNLKF